MASSYEQAVSALYRAPHGSFVVERRRLAAELKAEGDKTGAARLAKLERPPLSAWAEQLLGDAGHSASDATLRRVTMTLSGLAAAGGFEPDAPGALSKDREP